MQPYEIGPAIIDATMTGGQALEVQNQTGAKATAMDGDAMEVDSEGRTGMIREDLEEALGRDDLDFKGDFSFKRTYEDAPNPTLSLAGLGLVGLPLSIRDAEAIKTQCIQAPFGKGDKTLVDKTVRGTWEMDGSLVQFRNSDWIKFIGSAVVEVCSSLGVSFSTSQPRCELYKLLLYEAGSHFLPHVDTEKPDGMFATVIVVLPSKFTGGALHLSHGELSAVYDCSPGSHWQTSVMAWYTDVIHEVKPIESGHRLALAYNLIHTTQSLRPALSTNSTAMTSLANVLRTWASAEGKGAPKCIYYLLDHKYSQANLKASALKGKDAHKAGLLDTLAKTYGLSLGLASVCCHQVGVCSDRGKIRPGRWYDDSDTEWDEGPWSFRDVNDQHMSIEHFVDMDGKLISRALKYSQEEAIPEELEEMILEDEDYEEEYEGYQGNSAGELERWHRRTVLVIWPNWNSFAMLYSSSGIAKACKDLSSRLGSKPCEDDVRLARHILTLDPGVGPSSAIQVVCDAACKWNDADLWCQAIDVGCLKRGVRVLPLENVLRGLQIFGFQSMRPGLEQILDKETGNGARLTFVNDIVQWAHGLRDEGAAPRFIDKIGPWATRQSEKALKTLSLPTPDEYETISRAAIANGGTGFLKEFVLPQLIALGNDELLRSFAVQLHSDEAFPHCVDKTSVVSGLLSSAIAKTTVFRPPEAYLRKEPTESRAIPPSTTFRLAEACIAAGCPTLLQDLIDKVLDMVPLQNMHPGDTHRLLWEVIFPFTTYLIGSGAKESCQTRFMRLQLGIIELFFSWLQERPGPLTEEMFGMFLAALDATNTPEPFVSSVVPRLQTITHADDLQLVIVELDAHKQMTAMASGQGPGPILHSLLDRYIVMLPLNIQSILNALNWLAGIQRLDGCLTLLQRATSTTLSREYIDTTLVPLLPKLREWGASRSMAHILPMTYQAVVSAWLDIALGPLPTVNPALGAELADLNKHWTCTCAECAKARHFLTQSPAKSVDLRQIGAPKRRHVEDNLTLHAIYSSRFKTIRGAGKQGLTISKSEPLFELLRWQSEQKKMQGILDSITKDPEELVRLLGPVYDHVLAIVRGSTAPRVGIAAEAAHDCTHAPTPPILAPVPPSPLTASSSSGVAAPLRDVALTATKVHEQDEEDPDIIVVSSTISSSEPRRSTRKRKMLPYNDSEVIDLS